jgi:prepilin-type processing-associated H-X9-DG protein
MMIAIGVLGILAAMLFAGVREARGRAHRVGCMSNLKQLGMSFQVYFQEAAEQRDVTAYFPSQAAEWAGRAALRFPVASSIVASFRAFAETNYPEHDLYNEVHQYDFGSGRYWKTLGDGDSVLNWDYNVWYSDLWGGVAGSESIEDYYGGHVIGTGDEDGFGFQDRVINDYTFMGKDAMSNQSQGAEVFRCPSDTSRWEEIGNSYAGNWRPAADPLWNFQGGPVPYWRALNFSCVERVANPARMVLAGDAGWMRCVRNDGAPWMSWHGSTRKYNTLFLDGHVNFVKFEIGELSGDNYTCDAPE